MPAAPRSLSTLRSIGLACALVLGATACGDDAADPTGGDTEIGEPAAATNPAHATTTPTTAAPTTTTTAPAAPVGRRSAEEAARTLYDAWVADDRTTARTVADPDALEAMFAATPGPYELYRGCDAGEFDTGGCLLRDRTTDNTIQVNLERRQDVWVVAGVVFSPG